MAMMSGHHGYRPTERFIRDNGDDLRRLLDWPRQAMPSNVTLRAVLQAVDVEALAAIFRAWAAERLPEGEILAVQSRRQSVGPGLVLAVRTLRVLDEPAVRAALDLFEHHAADFADALLSVQYRAEGSALATFDRAASRLPLAQRLGEHDAP